MVEKRDVRGRSPRRKKYYIVILILFLFLFAGIIVHFRLNTKNKLRSKIEAIHAAGYPVTLEELDQLYSIPDNAENAADFILDAISYYADTNDSRVLKIADWKTLSPQGESLSEEIMKHAVSYLRDNQKSLESLHDAGLLSKDELDRFEQAQDYLVRIRNRLHYVSGRKNDQLFFDLIEILHNFLQVRVQVIYQVLGGFPQSLKVLPGHLQDIHPQDVT